MAMRPFSIRMEQQTLNDFHKWCQENDTTMSDEIRKYVWSKVGKPKNVVRKRKPKNVVRKEEDFFDKWFEDDELPDEMDFAMNQKERQEDGVGGN